MSLFISSQQSWGGWEEEQNTLCAEAGGSVFPGRSLAAVHSRVIRVRRAGLSELSTHPCHSCALPDSEPEHVPG